MRSILLTVLTVTGLLALATAAPQSVPPGHPQVAPPQLPSGHPQVQMPDQQAPRAVTANPADVESVEAVLDAYYESISGPKGQAREWDRFQSLFAPDARFITVKPTGGSEPPVSMTTDLYVTMNKNYFERGGYFESDINRSIDEYGRIAQVFSTFESRRAENESPYSRGVNSFQMIFDGQRWWITTLIWQLEHPEVGMIPPTYLPETSP